MAQIMQPDVWDWSTGVRARAVGLCRLSRKVCVAGKMNLRFQRWNRCNTRRVGPITLSERFGKLCLNQDVLPLALMTIHDTLRNGQLENNIQHRQDIFRIKPSSLCIARRQWLCLYYFFTKYLHILCFHHGCCWLYCPGRAWFFMVRVSFRDIKQAILPCKLFVQQRTPPIGEYWASKGSSIIVIVFTRVHRVH